MSKRKKNYMVFFVIEVVVIVATLCVVTYKGVVLLLSR